MKRYLIRLDDACPTMNRKKWDWIELLLDKYGIKPMVGIIPNCEDDNLMKDSVDPDFWDKVRNWQEKGWTMALHGYNHCYISNKGLNGLNPLWERSEFSGVSYEIQCQKIRDGYSILKQHGLNPQYFFAPSHTFDMNTLQAIKANTDIRIISDTIATKPYKKYGFIFIPQLGGHCTEMMLPGIWTFCLHPTMMSDDSFYKTELFVEKFRRNFMSFDELDLSNLKRKDISSRLLSWSYFLYRHIRRIK